jgi:hypothetical protein
MFVQFLLLLLTLLIAAVVLTVVAATAAIVVAATVIAVPEFVFTTMDASRVGVAVVVGNVVDAAVRIAPDGNFVVNGADIGVNVVIFIYSGTVVSGGIVVIADAL